MKEKRAMALMWAGCLCFMLGSGGGWFLLGSGLCVAGIAGMFNIFAVLAFAVCCYYLFGLLFLT